MGARPRAERGRAGGAGRGDGWEEPEIERYVARWAGRRVVVEREDRDGGSEPPYPVRVRGVAGG